MPSRVEEAIASALAAMRTHAAAGESDDYYGDWARDALDRRPLIVVAVATDSGVHAWAMEPGHDGVLTVAPAFPDGAPVAELGVTDRTLHDIATAVDWLMRDATGLSLSDAA